MQPNIQLPRGWPHHTRSAIVQILALSHYIFTSMLARAAKSRSRTTSLRVEIDRLEHELAFLQEEMRIKDGRMDRNRPQRRPHYRPLERMAILELRAARGWSAPQTARRLQVAMTTLASWKACAPDGRHGRVVRDHRRRRNGIPQEPWTSRFAS